MESFEAFRRKGVFRIESTTPVETEFRDDSLKKDSFEQDGKLLTQRNEHLKAHSHLLQRSADSAVDCVNAEIGIFLSLRSNATICRRRTRKTQ